MFHIMVQCSNKFGQYLDQLISKESIVDCHMITAKYTGDVIGTCFFGIDLHILNDGECEFLRIMKKLMKPNLKGFLREFIRGWLPSLYNFIGYYLQPHDVNAYFMQTVTNVIEYRLKNNAIKHDFADILVDLKKHPEKLPELELTNEILVAQAFILFVAGYFTSYTTMSHILHELALNPHIQKQLKEEITNELEKTGGAIEYESIKRMSYLDAIFKETLRKHPAVTHIMRHAVTDYTFSGIKQLRIRKGQRIWIPIRQFQHDPDIFCNPEVFDPERFMGNTELIDSMYYLPFGTGSRNCIGARFGTYEIKVGIVRIIRNFKLDVCEESGSQATNQPRSFLLSPSSMYLKFTKINHD
nr:PREDICTED: probable cytochrome P450 6a21 [Linepithema humile]